MITQNIIGFQLSALSDKAIYASNPDTLTTLPEGFSPATESETNLAVEKAYMACRIFRNIEGDRKADFLNHIASGIEDLGALLVQRIMQETAYPEARITSERNRTCAQLRMFAEEAMHGAWCDDILDVAMPERAPLPRPEIRRRMISIGPVIVFGASNFPLAYSTAGGDVASALAAGCPVIVKAHESHLGTNALVAEVIMNAARGTGMPDGVFSSLNGNGLHTGRQLVLHPLTAAVGFTGSKNGGRALFDLGQQRPNPIPVFAEMGSVNPIFLLPGKVAEDNAALVSQLVASMTMTVGQFCTNPGILVALDDKHTAGLIEQLKVALENVSGATMLNKGIFNSFQKGIAVVKGEKGVLMVNAEKLNTGWQATPVLASVSADVFLSNPSLHHEVFGPFSLIVLCANHTQMRLVAEALEGQLTATVQAADHEWDEASNLVDILLEKAGRIVFNGVPTGVEVCAAMTHGGPYPASTDSRFTAVGHHSVYRWLRPVTFQNFPIDFPKS